MGTQDIKITPRTGSTTGLPEIFFQGSGTTASGITMSVHGSGDIIYDGHQGELFRLTNNLQTGTIFSVKDISGLDQIALDATGTINLNTYYGTTWFGNSGTYGTTNLDAVDIDGAVQIDGTLVLRLLRGMQAIPPGDNLSSI